LGNKDGAKDMKNKKKQYTECLYKWGALLDEFELLHDSLPFILPRQYSYAEINVWNKEINHYIEKLQDLKYYSMSLLNLPFEEDPK
jgi:hypothetical protein